MKSYTSLEQSKKLAEILPIESADMYYFLDPTPAGNIYHLTVQRVDVGIKNLPQYDEGDIPCWSLTTLLKLIPKSIISTPNPFSDNYCCRNIEFDMEFYANNPVDACYEMILKLHEQKIL